MDDTKSHMLDEVSDTGFTIVCNYCKNSIKLNNWNSTKMIKVGKMPEGKALFINCDKCGEEVIVLYS